MSRFVRLNRIRLVHPYDGDVGGNSLLGHPPLVSTHVARTDRPEVHGGGLRSVYSVKTYLRFDEATERCPLPASFIRLGLDGCATKLPPLGSGTCRSSSSSMHGRMIGSYRVEPGDPVNIHEPRCTARPSRSAGLDAGGLCTRQTTSRRCMIAQFLPALLQAALGGVEESHSSKKTLRIAAAHTSTVTRTNPIIYPVRPTREPVAHLQNFQPQEFRSLKQRGL